MIHKQILGAFALAFILVAGLATAGILYAQKAGGMGGMMGMMSMMESCPMAGAMAQSPAAVLEHREELGLTDAQVTKLEALQEGVKQARMQAMEQMGVIHQEIAGVTGDEEFDEAATRAAFDRMGDLHTEMGVSMLRTRHEARQTLTPEQREQLAELGGGMMGMDGMMGMMGGMDMENCPMMQDGMMDGMDNMDMQMQGSGRGSMQR
ncbi:MAG: Spy/CpxP family protein refolding chaperone [Longimicrobiaceae bacterium]